MTVEWLPHAERLAAQVTHPASSWWGPVVSVPRHELVPRWFVRAPGERDRWELHVGEADERAWIAAAYSDRTLVTSVEGVHADHAGQDERTVGRSTSSSTLPTLIVHMLDCLLARRSMTVVEVGTGSGYGTALLARQLGDSRVTSIDVDSYLTAIAARRLDQLGLHPRLIDDDGRGTLPGEFDRLVATVSVRPIPASWLAALKPGGRLVAVIANTSLLITADKTTDGGARGVVNHMPAAFMTARSGRTYPQERDFAAPGDDAGETSWSPYPFVAVGETRDLKTMLELAAPGIQHGFEKSSDGKRTAWMYHSDGSWARAAAIGGGPVIVQQRGPRKLWDIVDLIRRDWLENGCESPIRGANVRITPDGVVHLKRGRWQATIA